VEWKGLLELDSKDEGRSIFENQKKEKSEFSFGAAKVMSIEFQFDGDSTRLVESDESNETISRGD
jgi:hypothetical protein